VGVTGVRHPREERDEMGVVVRDNIRVHFSCTLIHDLCENSYLVNHDIFPKPCSKISGMPSKL